MLIRSLVTGLQVLNAKSYTTNYVTDFGYTESFGYTEENVFWFSLSLLQNCC